MAFPCDITLPCIDIEFSCQQEEIVAQAIDIRGNSFIDLDAAFYKTEHAAFGSPTYGSAYMSIGGFTTASREYEQAQGWDNGFEAVDFCLDGADHLLCHDGFGVFLGGGIICSEIASHDKQG